MDDIEIAVDDPALPDVRAVIERHLAFANSIAEPQDVHAMGATALSDPTITFFSARRAGSVLAIGALKRLNDDHYEIKSMHTVSEARRLGLARTVLRHLVTYAGDVGARRVSLETGAMPEMAPSRALYRSFGFVECERFGEYPPGRNNVFMTLKV